MTRLSCEPSHCSTCCVDTTDLRAPARRGLAWASATCLLGALASTGLASRTTDDLHRVMFEIFTAGLAAAGIVLFVARWTLRGRP